MRKYEGFAFLEPASGTWAREYVRGVSSIRPEQSLAEVGGNGCLWRWCTVDVAHYKDEAQMSQQLRAYVANAMKVVQ